MQRNAPNIPYEAASNTASLALLELMLKEVIASKNLFFSPALSSLLIWPEGVV